MKHYKVLLLSFLSIILMASCNNSGNGGDEPTPDYGKLIVGKWRTADSTYFEVYNSDGTGKYWDLSDDLQEDEAKLFRWEMDKEVPEHFMQWHQMEITGDEVPQGCMILELTEKKFRYNNEAFRAEYSLIRAE